MKRNLENEYKMDELLIKASETNNTELAEYAVKAGADFDYWAIHCLVTAASESNDLMIQFFLNRGVSLNKAIQHSFRYGLTKAMNSLKEYV